MIQRYTKRLVQDPPEHEKLTVTVLMRAARSGGYSIEAVFDTVLTHLPDDIAAHAVRASEPARGIVGRLRSAWAARSAARESTIVHMSGDEHFLVYFLPRRRTILTIHDCEILNRSRGIKRLLLWLLWFWIPIRRVACVTTVSETTRDELLGWVGIDPSQVVVIENPLSKPLKRTEFQFSEEQPNVLMIGTAPHKNIERTIHALAGMPLKVTLVGKISNDRLELLLASGVEIIALQNISDAELAAAYAKADMILFPSLSEGFGLPILEAQAVGRPVVTSNREPMKGVAGKGALLVDPESATAIRNAVQQIIDDGELRATLVANGFDNVTRFAPQNVAARYAQVYRKVAKTAAR